MLLGIAGKVLVIWFCILVLAVANGVLREAVFFPALGKVPGFMLSGVLLSILIFAVSYFTVSWLGASTAKEYGVIGLAWLCLTLSFELILGHLIQGKPWSDLIEAYTFKEGDIWPVVLFVTAMAPYITAKIRGLV